MFGGTEGVIRTRVGYAGGLKKNPRYHDLGDHTETINIIYDPKVVTFEKLLSLFWGNHNPSIPCQQQYKSVIFYHNKEQRILAQHSLTISKQTSSSEINTEIHPANTFYVAENYHQKYILQQHPWLIVALQIQTGEEFIKSHACSKLNGFLSCYYELEELPEIGKKLGLNEKMIQYINIQLKKSQYNFQK